MKRFFGACLLVFLILYPDLSMYGQGVSRYTRWIRRAPRFLKKMVTGFELDDKILYPDKIVIGTEPSWLLDGDFSDHKYKLLSDLVVSEYDINPVTGQYRSASAFRDHLTRTTEIKKYGDDQVDRGNATILDCADILNPGIRFLVEISYQGDFGRKDWSSQYLLQFLANEGKNSGNDRHRVIVDTLRQLANTWELQYDVSLRRRGIVIDFDHVRFSESMQNHLVQFLKTLHNDLGDYYSRFYFKFRGSAPPPPALIKDVAQYIDLFIVKAYSFEPDYAEAAAPTAVFDSASASSLQGILHTMREFDIPLHKMVLEFPYFVSSWIQPVRADEWTSDPENRLMTYNALYPVLRRNGPVRYQDSSYAYIEIPSTDARYPARKYCFEDSLTLGTKYRWSDTQGLPGIALWGLGYNTGKESLKFWEAVANQYGRPAPEVIWYGIGLVFFLMSMGFPYALWNSWEVRNITAKYTKYAWRSVGLSLLFFLFFIICSNPGLRNTAGLMLGAAILVVYAFMVVIRRYLMRARRYMRYAGVKT